jgi:hypothetical protein
MKKRHMDSDSPAQETTTTPPKLDYGVSFNKALCKRLERHFSSATHDAEGKGSRALVVGLFGEWGCGKTLHLRHIHHYFLTALEQAGDSVITLPVFFNAWRYEAEDHLIVPLLKTTEHQTRQWLESTKSRGEEAVSWLKDKAARLGDAAIAIGCGI